MDIITQDNIIYKTEFANSIVKTNKISVNEPRSHLLQLKSYQLFIKNFINYNTEHTRILINHETGTGKTITALNTAVEFIKVFKQQTSLNTEEIGSIFIIGFTKSIFKNELLSRVEYGIVNQREIDELKKYLSIQEKNLEQIAYIRELQTRYNKRINNRTKNGYYKFIGYKELFNKLLVIKSNIKIDTLNESLILNYIKTGDIEINLTLLQSFKNSLVICDEIHNVWNTIEKNNWGISLQIIFSYYSNNIRVLLMSATPLTNSPVEVISLINLLSKKENHVKFNDIFDTNSKVTEIGKQVITRSLEGKISFIQGRNVELFPRKEIMGEKMKHIPLMKFIRCPMSKLQFNTYKHESLETSKSGQQPTTESSSEEYKLSESIKREMTLYPINLSLYNRYLMDYVLPNPLDNKLGIFKSNRIRELYEHADTSWLNNNGISFTSTENSAQISGTFMLHENMKEYSSKYSTLYTYLKNIIINKEGKILIFHQYVSNSGVLFISEFLKVNGFLDEFSPPVSNSRCSICFNIMKDHGLKIKDHTYKALRFSLAYGDLSKNQISTTLSKFNASDNKNGDDIKILLGSRFIKEGFDLKSVRHLFITHMPDNISILQQVFGRAVRTNSHAELPLDSRIVKIYILVTSLPLELRHFSFEEMLYKKKLETYSEIQDIENIIHKSAIDYLIQSNVNVYEGNLVESKLITRPDIPLELSKLDNYSFNAYYINEHIDYIQFIIKRLFISISPVFDYDYLFKLTQDPPFNVNRNTTIITEGNFLIALNNLLRNTDNNIFLNKYKLEVRLTGPYSNKNNVIYYIIKELNSKNDLNALDRIKSNTFKTNINITQFINSNSNSFSVDKDVRTFLQSSIDILHIDDLRIIYTYNIIFQSTLIEYCIKHLIKNSDKEFDAIVNLIIQYYNMYNIIIFSDDTRIASRSIKTNKRIPIGYKFETAATILYNNEFIVDRIPVVNRSQFKNSKIYGIQTIEGNNIKFKLIESENTLNKDKRSNETGIVCGFKQKSELMQIMDFLKIKSNSKKRKAICDDIESKLLELEIKEREKKSNIKWFYTIA